MTTPCLHSREGLSRVAPCAICGERKPVSASEIKLARTCWRKWAFRYASSHPKPEETQAQRDGTQLHTLIAKYLTDGTRPDPSEWMGELANAGIDSGLLPAAGSGAVETPHALVLDGLPFVVIRDWAGCTPDVPENAGPGAPWTVLDHKTSSNPSRYAIKSNAERLDDPQHLLYGCGIGDEAMPGDVAYRWLYYPTKGRGKVTAYDGILTRREIRGGLERVVLPVAERAWRLRENEIDPNSLEPNTASCTLFNRPCEYTDVCDVNRTAVAMRSLGEENMSSPAPGLFASLPPVNGAPAALAAPAANPVPAAPFSFGFPNTPQAAGAQLATDNGVQALPPPPVTPTIAPVAPPPVARTLADVGAMSARRARAVVCWYEEEGDNEIRSSRAEGKGATMDEAIKNALAALPR